jgi:hypothetical protein
MGRAVRGLPPLRCHCRSRRRLGGEAWAIHPCSHGFADCSETHRLASAHPPLLARVCLKCMRVVDEVQPSTPARTGLPRASRRRPLSRPIHPCSHGFARVTSFGSQYMNHPPLLARVCLPFRVLKRGGMPSTPARTGLPSRDMLNATLSAIHPCSHGFARKTPSAPRHAHPSTPAASSAPPIAIHPCSHWFASWKGLRKTALSSSRMVPGNLLVRQNRAVRVRGVAAPLCCLDGSSYRRIPSAAFYRGILGSHRSG